MADVKTAYGSVQTMTCTLTSVADGAGRETTEVDNSSNKYVDALVAARIKTHTSGTISPPSSVFFYAYAAIDGGTDYPDVVTGSDAAITTQPVQLKLLGQIPVAALNTSYKGGPWSIRELYGGSMPEWWGVVVWNDTGVALSGTGSDHFLKYQGIYATLL